jgi:hypothetical protein
MVKPLNTSTIIISCYIDIPTRSARRLAASTTARHNALTTSLTTVLLSVRRTRKQGFVLAARKTFGNQYITMDIIERIHHMTTEIKPMVLYNRNNIETYHGTDIFTCPHGSSTFEIGVWQSPHVSTHCLVQGWFLEQRRRHGWKHVTATWFGSSG